MSRRITVSLTEQQFLMLGQAVDSMEQDLTDQSDRRSSRNLRVLQAAWQKFMTAWYR